MRKLIRSIANKLGYDFIKINVHSNDKAKYTHKVAIGNYELDMPGNNPQISTYKYEPDANSQLARLTEIILNKYSNLSVLDIGANVGDTIAVIKNKANVPIIGIEGDDISYAFLEKNTKQFEHILLLKTFLGEKKETKNIAIEKEGWNNTLIPSADGDKKIDFKTLDEVLLENGLMNRQLKLLKVDTEGFDTIILRGALDLIKQKKPILYFEYNRSNMEAIQENGLATLLSFKDYGYGNILFFDNRGRHIITLPITAESLITQLHFYMEEANSEIHYYDVCLFHTEDADLEKAFIKSERNHISIA